MVVVSAYLDAAWFVVMVVYLGRWYRDMPRKSLLFLMPGLLSLGRIALHVQPHKGLWLLWLEGWSIRPLPAFVPENVTGVAHAKIRSTSRIFGDVHSGNIDSLISFGLRRRVQAVAQPVWELLDIAFPESRGVGNGIREVAHCAEVIVGALVAPVGLVLDHWLAHKTAPKRPATPSRLPLAPAASPMPAAASPAPAASSTPAPASPDPSPTPPPNR